MAWTSPATWLAGSTLTAAQLNEQVRDNSLAGGPIYTTEALRDAAIPAPFEGQQAYITAPPVTTTTATGGVTAIPIGIQTIYNGASWTCITPVSAYTTTSGTVTSGSYTTLTGGGTAPSVTLSTGLSALVTFTVVAAAPGGSVGAAASVAVSGASTVAASDSWWAFTDNSSFITLSRTFVMVLPTAGVNTFALQYRMGSAGTGTFSTRAITVQGIA